MKNGILLMVALPVLAGLGVAHAQSAVTPEFVMANNDLNKDGVITRDEATKAGVQLAKLWDSFDMNRDGKIDMDEVKKGLARGPSASAAATKPAATKVPPGQPSAPTAK